MEIEDIIKEIKNLNTHLHLFDRDNLVDECISIVETMTEGYCLRPI